MITTFVRSVQQRGSRWLIKFSADPKGYMTGNAWKAAICQRALERKRLVTVWGGGGCYYKELDEVREVPEMAKSDANKT